MVNQFNAFDIAEIRRNVRAMIGGRESDIGFHTVDYVTFDEHYNLPSSELRTITEVSGVIGRVSDEDKMLIDMGGKLKVGDVKLTFYQDVLINAIDITKLLQPETKVEIPASSNVFYIIDAKDTTGIKFKNRIVLGMVESIAYPS